MNKTENLELMLTDRSEWPSKLMSQYLLDISGDNAGGSSNMQIIDKAFGDLYSQFSRISDYLANL